MSGRGRERGLPQYEGHAGLHPHTLPGDYGDRRAATREGLKRSYSQGDRPGAYRGTYAVLPGPRIDRDGRIRTFKHGDKRDFGAIDARPSTYLRDKKAAAAALTVGRKPEEPKKPVVEESERPKVHDAQETAESKKPGMEESQKPKVHDTEEATEPKKPHAGDPIKPGKPDHEDWTMV